MVLVRSIPLLILLGSAPAEAANLLMAPLENEAGLSDSESSTLSAAIHGVFINSSDIVAVVVQTAPCDNRCMKDQCWQTGTLYYLTGRVTLFAGEFVVTIDIRKIDDDRIVKSATTGSFPTLKGILPAATAAAGQLLRDFLPITASPAISPPPVPAATTAPVQSPVSSPVRTAPPSRNWDRGDDDNFNSASGSIFVTTNPTGASVYLVGDDEDNFIGYAPVSKNLEQGKYRIAATKKGYRRQTALALVLIGETKNVKLKLKPVNPLRGWGIVSLVFSTPMVVAGGCGIPATDRFSTERRGFVALLSAGIVLTATGVSLLVLSRKYRPRKDERRRGLTNLFLNRGTVSF